MTAGNVGGAGGERGRPQRRWLVLMVFVTTVVVASAAMASLRERAVRGDGDRGLSRSRARKGGGHTQQDAPTVYSIAPRGTCACGGGVRVQRGQRHRETPGLHRRRRCRRRRFLLNNFLAVLYIKVSVTHVIISYLVDVIISYLVNSPSACRLYCICPI